MAYVLKENPSKTMCWIAQTQHDNKDENTKIIAWSILRWYSSDIRCPGMSDQASRTCLSCPTFFKY